MAADTASWTAPAIADVILPVCEAALADRQGDYARVVSLLAPRRSDFTADLSRFPRWVELDPIELRIR